MPLKKIEYAGKSYLLPGNLDDQELEATLDIIDKTGETPKFLPYEGLRIIVPRGTPPDVLDAHLAKVDKAIKEGINKADIAELEKMGFQTGGASAQWDPALPDFPEAGAYSPDPAPPDPGYVPPPRQAKPGEFGWQDSPDLAPDQKLARAGASFAQLATDIGSFPGKAAMALGAGVEAGAYGVAYPFVAAAQGQPLGQLYEGFGEALAEGPSHRLWQKYKAQEDVRMEGVAELASKVTRAGNLGEVPILHLGPMGSIPVDVYGQVAMLFGPAALTTVTQATRLQHALRGAGKLENALGRVISSRPVQTSMETIEAVSTFLGAPVPHAMRSTPGTIGPMELAVTKSVSPKGKITYQTANLQPSILRDLGASARAGAAFPAVLSAPEIIAQSSWEDVNIKALETGYGMATGAMVGLGLHGGAQIVGSSMRLAREATYSVLEDAIGRTRARRLADVQSAQAIREGLTAQANREQNVRDWAEANGVEAVKWEGKEPLIGQEEGKVINLLDPMGNPKYAKEVNDLVDKALAQRVISAKTREEMKAQDEKAAELAKVFVTAKGELQTHITTGNEKHGKIIDIVNRTTTLVDSMRAKAGSAIDDLLIHKVGKRLVADPSGMYSPTRDAIRETMLAFGMGTPEEVDLGLFVQDVLAASWANRGAGRSPNMYYDKKLAGLKGLTEDEAFDVKMAELRQRAVLGKDGEPVVLSHGTEPGGIRYLDPDLIGADGAIMGGVGYGSVDPRVAEGYRRTGEVHDGPFLKDEQSWARADKFVMDIEAQIEKTRQLQKDKLLAPRGPFDFGDEVITGSGVKILEKGIMTILDVVKRAQAEKGQIDYLTHIERLFDQLTRDVYPELNPDLGYEVEDWLGEIKMTLLGEAKQVWGNIQKYHLLSEKVLDSTKMISPKEADDWVNGFEDFTREIMKGLQHPLDRFEHDRLFHQHEAFGWKSEYKLAYVLHDMLELYEETLPRQEWLARIDEIGRQWKGDPRDWRRQLTFKGVAPERKLFNAWMVKQGYDALFHIGGTDAEVWINFWPEQWVDAYTKRPVPSMTDPSFDGAFSRVAVEYLTDGKALLKAFQGANVTDAIGAFTKVFGHSLETKEQTRIAKSFGKEKWDKEVEERFSRGFQGYLMTGTAPVTSLAPAFELAKRQLTTLLESGMDTTKARWEDFVGEKWDKSRWLTVVDPSLQPASPRTNPFREALPTETRDFFQMALRKGVERLTGREKDLPMMFTHLSHDQKQLVDQLEKLDIYTERKNPGIREQFFRLTKMADALVSGRPGAREELEGFLSTAVKGLNAWNEKHLELSNKVNTAEAELQTILQAINDRGFGIGGWNLNQDVSPRWKAYEKGKAPGTTPTEYTPFIEKAIAESYDKDSLREIFVRLRALRESKKGSNPGTVLSARNSWDSFNRILSTSIDNLRNIARKAGSKQTLDTELARSEVDRLKALPRQDVTGFLETLKDHVAGWILDARASANPMAVEEETEMILKVCRELAQNPASAVDTFKKMGLDTGPLEAAIKSENPDRVTDEMRRIQSAVLPSQYLKEAVTRGIRPTVFKTFAEAYAGMQSLHHEGASSLREAILRAMPDPLERDIATLLTDLHGVEGMANMAIARKNEARARNRREPLSAEQAEEIRKEYRKKMQLRPETRAALLEVNHLMEQAWAEAVNSGVFSPADFVADYINRIYSQKDVSAVMAYIHSKGAMDAPNAHSMFRVFETLYDALDAAGLRPATLDIAELAGEYIRSVGRSSMRQMLMRDLRRTTPESFRWVGENDPAPRGYVDLNQVYHESRATELKERLVVQQDLGRLLNNMTAPSFVQGNRLIRAVADWNGWYKHTTLTLDIYHMKQLLQAGAAEGMNYSVDQLKDAWKAISDINDPNHAAVQMLQAAGLSVLGGDYTPFSEYYDRSIKNVLEKHPFARLAAPLTQKFNELAWGKFVPALKVATALELFQRRMLENPNAHPEDVARAVASHINKTAGGRSWVEKGRSKSFEDTLRFMLLAPDWVTSRFGLALGGATGIVKGATGFTNEVHPWRDELQKMDRNFWLNLDVYKDGRSYAAGYLLQGMMFTAAVNSLMMAMDPTLKKENEGPDYFWKIKLPWRDKWDRPLRISFVPNVDYIMEAFETTGQFFRSRQSPALKLLWDAFSGTDFTGRDVGPAENAVNFIKNAMVPVPMPANPFVQAAMAKEGEVGLQTARSIARMFGFHSRTNYPYALRHEMAELETKKLELERQRAMFIRFGLGDLFTLRAEWHNRNLERWMEDALSEPDLNKHLRKDVKRLRVAPAR